MESGGFGDLFGDPEEMQGDAEAQAEQIRAVIARVFPEAVALVREARSGLQ
jgi:hypothetical protein